MSNETPVPAVDLLHLWKPYWLPPRGRGNGLDALFWATIADVTAADVPGLLERFRQLGIPAWAAPLSSIASARGAEDLSAPYRVWVATIDLNAAEDAVMRVLSESAEADRAQAAGQPQQIGRRHRHVGRRE